MNTTDVALVVLLVILFFTALFTRSFWVAIGCAMAMIWITLMLAYSLVTPNVGQAL